MRAQLCSAGICFTGALMLQGHNAAVSASCPCTPSAMTSSQQVHNAGPAMLPASWIGGPTPVRVLLAGLPSWPSFSAVTTAVVLNLVCPMAPALATEVMRTS